MQVHVSINTFSARVSTEDFVSKLHLESCLEWALGWVRSLSWSLISIRSTPSRISCISATISCICQNQPYGSLPPPRQINFQKKVSICLFLGENIVILLQNVDVSPSPLKHLQKFISFGEGRLPLLTCQKAEGGRGRCRKEEWRSRRQRSDRSSQTPTCPEHPPS